MQHLAAITIPPIGVLIASGLDPEAIEKLAEFTERHPAFCLVVAGLWFVRSGLQFWVMTQHKNNATAAAMLSVINQAGGVSAILGGPGAQGASKGEQ